MGGRGGAGLSAKRGRRVSAERFLKNLRDNNQDEMLNTIAKAPLTVGKASFTVNGNAVKSQEATLESASDRISVRFYNGWEPTQVTRPERKITTKIEAVTYKNGNATAVRTLYEKSSKSLKNAASNYENVLDKWKKVTGQKTIRL
ncbi:MAG: hypothetical protein LUD83_03425 [Clostridiales bacterium]|nr:hypothetical protein [Clostridiales bacterium]